MSALGTEAPSTWGKDHWTHRHPEKVRRGSDHYMAKLEEWQVEEMRWRAKQGASIASLALEYGINYQHCKDIVRGRKWKHVRAA